MSQPAPDLAIAPEPNDLLLPGNCQGCPTVHSFAARKKTPHPQGREVSRYHPDFASAGMQRLASLASAALMHGERQGVITAPARRGLLAQMVSRAFSLQLEGHFPPEQPMPPFHQLRLSVLVSSGVLVLVTVLH